MEPLLLLWDLTGPCPDLTPGRPSPELGGQLAYCRTNPATLASALG